MKPELASVELGTLAGCRAPHWLPGVLGLALLLAGCRFSPPVIGLRPIYPPAVYPSYGDALLASDGEIGLLFVKINSLQPTMKWQTFPTDADRKADQHGKLSHIGPVSYDLRIWRVNESGSPAEIVYEREGLPASSHQLTTRLRPATRYCWTVRARFDLDGQPRVTLWGFSKWPWNPGDATSAGGAESSSLDIRNRVWNPQRIEQVRPANYYRFETP